MKATVTLLALALVIGLVTAAFAGGSDVGNGKCKTEAAATTSAN